MGKVLIFIGALVFCAHLFATLFSRRRIPDVLFLVMIGIIVGPVLGVVTPDMFGELGMVFASLTLVVILADSFNRVFFSSEGYSIGLGARLCDVINRL